MPNVFVEESSLRNAANAIRAKTGTTDPIKPSDFASKINEIQVGGNTDEAYNRGVEAGKQAQHDEFWDDLLLEGARYNFIYGFAGHGWKASTFYPTHSMFVTNAQGMFTHFGGGDGFTLDLVQRLIDCGNLILDFTDCNNLNSCFAYANISKVGIVDARKITTNSNWMYLFTGSFLKHIEEFIVCDTNPSFRNVFYNSTALTHVIFSGKIAQNDLNLQWSKLDIASLKSLLDCLVDKSEDTSGTIWKVTVGSANLTTIKNNLAAKYAAVQAKGWYID